MVDTIFYLFDSICPDIVILVVLNLNQFDVNVSKRAYFILILWPVL